MLYIYDDVIDATGDKQGTERRVFEAAELALSELVDLVKKAAAVTRPSGVGRVLEDRVLHHGPGQGHNNAMPSGHGSNIAAAVTATRTFDAVFSPARHPPPRAHYWCPGGVRLGTRSVDARGAHADRGGGWLHPRRGNRVARDVLDVALEAVAFAGDDERRFPLDAGWQTIMSESPHAGPGLAELQSWRHVLRYGNSVDAPEPRRRGAGAGRCRRGEPPPRGRPAVADRVPPSASHGRGDPDRFWRLTASPPNRSRDLLWRWRGRGVPRCRRTGAAPVPAVNGVRVDGLTSHVVLGIGTLATGMYVCTLGAATWAAFESQWWLVVAAAAAGGSGYALGARQWSRAYHQDPAAHVGGVSPRMLAVLAALACLGLAVLLFNG